MSIITTVSTTKGKCIGCAYYTYEGTDWTSGDCGNEKSQVKNKQRWWNSKICRSWKRGVK